MQVSPSDPDGSQVQHVLNACAASLAGFILTVAAVTYQLFTLEEITKEAIFLLFVRGVVAIFIL